MEVLFKVEAGIDKFPQNQVKIWWHAKDPEIPHKLRVFIHESKSIKSPAWSPINDHKAFCYFKQEAS